MIGSSLEIGSLLPQEQISTLRDWTLSQKALSTWKVNRNHKIYLPLVQSYLYSISAVRSTPPPTHTYTDSGPHLEKVLSPRKVNRKHKYYPPLLK